VAEPDPKRVPALQLILKQLDDRGIPVAWPWSFSRFQEAMARPKLADYDLA